MIVPLPPRAALHGAALTLLVMLSACGGGGGGGGGSADTTGSVGILVTDGPADGFAKLLLDVTRIELLGAGGHVTIFEGRRRFDLLSLREHSRLLSRHRGVPAGDWSKIRVFFEDPELIRVSAPEDVEGVEIPCPDDLDPVRGMVCESIIPKVPGGGKLDLNPRGPFTVRPGELVLVQLDVDANKSLFLHQTGNGRWILRPLVFIDVFTRLAPDRLAKIDGVVRSVDLLAGSLVLCRTHADRDDAGAALADRDACVDVQTDLGTGIFDEDAQPAGLADFAEGDRAAALGRFRVDAGESLVLRALWLQRGGLDALDRVKGEVLEGVAPGDDPPVLRIAAGESPTGPVRPVDLVLQPGAPLLTRDGRRVAPEDVAPGQHVHAFGVLFPGEGEPDQLDTTLAFVRDGDFAAGDASLRGVVSVPWNAATGQLTLNTRTDGGVVPRCLAIGPDDDVFRIVEDAATGMLRSERIAASDLEIGEILDVYGRAGATCFDAKTVVSTGFVEVGG